MELTEKPQSGHEYAETLLAAANKEQRGKLTVFLGAAAGVGAGLRGREAAAGGAALARALAEVAGFAADHRAEGLGHLHGFGVLQVHHVDVAGGAGLVEVGDQLAHRVELGGVLGAHQQAVGARVADHRDALAGVAADGTTGNHRGAHAAVGEQAGDGLREVEGRGVLQRDHPHVALGHVDGFDDLGDAADVLGVVGDDDGVVAGVGVDRVVRRYDRAQHRDQVHRVFVLQAEGAGLHAAAAGAIHRPAEQLGISLRHHLGHAAHIHHAEALHAQRRQQHVVGLVRGHLAFADQGQVALDPRVYQELLAGKWTWVIAEQDYKKTKEASSKPLFCKPFLKTSKI